MFRTIFKEITKMWRSWAFLVWTLVWVSSECMVLSVSGYIGGDIVVMGEMAGVVAAKCFWYLSSESQVGRAGHAEGTCSKIQGTSCGINPNTQSVPHSQEGDPQFPPCQCIMLPFFHQGQFLMSFVVRNSWALAGSAERAFLSSFLEQSWFSVIQGRGCQHITL